MTNFKNLIKFYHACQGHGMGNLPVAGSLRFEFSSKLVCKVSCKGKSNGIHKPKIMPHTVNFELFISKLVPSYPS